MKPRVFNPSNEILHKNWLSEILKVPISTYNSETTIDLSDSLLGIEIKSRLDKYYPRFSCVEHQIQNFPLQNQDKELFWAFMTYSLDTDVQNIKKVSEKRIISREVWVQPWNWINQYEAIHGKNQSYRYPSKKDLEKTTYKSFDVKKGIIHLPQNSSLIQRITDPNYTVASAEEDTPF